MTVNNLQTTSVLPSKWDKFKSIAKKDIVWNNSLFSPPLLLLRPVIKTNPNKISNSIFFLNIFLKMIFLKMVTFTNLYAEQNNVNFIVTNVSEFRTLIACHMLLGALKFPRVRMYWESKYRVNVIAGNISRNKLFELRNCFHVIDNKSIPANNNDKFIKVRPLNIYLTLQRTSC